MADPETLADHADQIEEAWQQWLRGDGPETFHAAFVAGYRAALRLLSPQHRMAGTAKPSVA